MVTTNELSGRILISATGDKFMKSIIAAILLTLLASIACAAQPPSARYRCHPDLVERAPTIKKVVLLEPDISIYEISAGGVKEEVKEWSAQGKQKIAGAVTDVLSTGNITILSLKRDDPQYAAEIKEIVALQEPVMWSIYLHTYNPLNLFSDKVNRFEYSLGSLEKLLLPLDADALLLVSGEDTVSTGGRIAVEVVKALTGMPRRFPTSMSVLLAARNGDVLWFALRAGN